MKQAIFAIAALALVGVLATATPADAGQTGHGQNESEGGGWHGYGYGYGYKKHKETPPSPELPSEVTSTPDFIDPWLLIRGQVMVKETPSDRAARVCAAPVKDFHRDIGGITLDKDQWTSLACIRARFERVEAMMAR